MAAVSPKLTVTLGLVVVAAAAFTYTNRGVEGDSLDTETFELPLAFVDSTDRVPVTTWAAPQATRNPFDSGAVGIDPERVEGAPVEPIESQPDVTITTTDPSTSATQSPSRTSTTLTLEQTIDRRVPPGAPPVTAEEPGDAITSETSQPGTAPTTSDALPGLDG